MFERVPQELKALPQWVGWQLIKGKDGEKDKKMPINPETGECAKSNDPTTWGTFEKAEAAIARFGLTGLGIMFANGIFGVDIDHCVENGAAAAFAQEIIDAVQSYTELSPSGTGIHILCRGKLPPGGRRKGAVEMYSEGRFFTVTGRPYGTEYPFDDCTERIKAMHEKYIGTPKQKPAAKQSRPPRSDYHMMNVDAIVQRAQKAQNGEKFRDLYNGDWGKHAIGDGTQSVVDQMFCGMLAFWCQKDGELMDAVFRSSGLMRPKWDQRRGAQTYGERTIARAISQCERVWEPPRSRPEKPPFPVEPPASSAPPPFPPDEGAPIDDSVPKGEGKPKVYRYDDTGNAQRFRDEHVGNIMFNHIDGVWFYWDGRRWAQDETGQIKRYADAMLEKMQKEIATTPEEYQAAYKRHVGKSRSHRGKEAFIAEAKHLDGIPLLPAQLDRRAYVLNVRNAMISLKDGRTREHAREWLISKLAEVSYDQNAKCPHWDKFLEEITCSNVELKLYLQRMIGYCLTASTEEQCLFFLYGSGSNGKSTFVDTIASMLGDYAASCQPETVMLRDRNNTARSDLARLKGARLVVTSEPNDGCRLDEGVVKQMTGGTENKVTARFLYGREFEFTPEFKIIMSTNYKPIIKGTDNGIWRRVRLIPFTAQFSDKEKDKALPEKLRQELPGILNWAVTGAIGWCRDGLPPCPLVDEAVQEYRSEMDRIQQFTEDCLLTEEGGAIPASKLYAVYKSWCGEQGDRYPMSNVKFFGELKKRFTVKKTAACNEYQGLSFSDHGLALAVLFTKERSRDDG